MRNAQIKQMRRLAMASLLSREVAEDHLVVDDTVLQAVVRGEQRLSDAERQAIVHSPRTLHRLRWLDHQARARAAQATASYHSELWLRAAAGEQDGFTIDTDDGRYSLHFLAGRDGNYLMVASCDSAHAKAMRERGEVLRVCDNQGHELLRGCPDEQGELRGSWPLSDSPRAYLSREGVGLVLDEVHNGE